MHDPSFDLHALLHDVCFPHLQALALDILVLEAPSDARALATLLQGTLALQRAAWSHLFPEALSAGVLLALHTLHAEGVPCAARRCSSGRARERMRGRGCARGAGAHARGGAVPPRGCVIREHRGDRARCAAVPAPVLAAHARGRLLARTLARHARARTPGTSLTPIYAAIRAL